jgi:hypothetical protein
MTRLSVATLSLLTLLCSVANAADFKGDNSDCWDDPSRNDIGCTKLSENFLMSLRYATRDQVRKAMNAAGREINPFENQHDLHFISNYTRGEKEGSGVANFIFDNETGKAIIIFAIIDAADSADHWQFIWNADLLPGACFDKPGSKMKPCKK